MNKRRAIQDKIGNGNDINKIKNYKLSLSNINNIHIPRPISNNK